MCVLYGLSSIVVQFVSAKLSLNTHLMYNNFYSFHMRENIVADT